MYWKRVVLAAAVAALAACSGDQPTPLQPPARFDLGTLEECQDQGPIKRLIASVFPAGTINDAQTRFASINRTYCIRSSDEAGRNQMYGLVALVASQFSTGQLNAVPLAPDGNPVPATTPEAVHELITRLYAYVGLEGANGFPITLAEVQQAAWDGAIALGLPNTPFQFVVHSENFASTAPAGFWRAPAWVLVLRQPDATPFQAFFTEYPPRYQVYVRPYEAHANLAVPAPSPLYKAQLAICADDQHPASGMAILRVPDAGMGQPHILPAGDGAALPLIECKEYADAPPAPIKSAQNGGIGGVFAAGRAMLGRAGSRVGTFFAPKPLYALDGGYGGESGFYSGFVAVDSRSGVSSLINFNTNPVTGAAIASGTLLNTYYTRSLGVTFAGVPGTSLSICGTDVYANDHGPLASGPYNFAFGTSNNNVSVCAPTVASDINQGEFGRVQATFATPATRVCIDVWVTAATTEAVLEAFAGTTSLGVVKSAAGAWGTPLCATGAGITRVQFSGAGPYAPDNRGTAVFDNLAVTYPAFF